MNNNFIISFSFEEKLIVRVKNNSTQVLNVLNWNTVLDFPYAHGFDILVNGKKIEYVGPYFKRIYKLGFSTVTFMPLEEKVIEYDTEDILKCFDIKESLLLEPNIVIRASSNFFNIVSSDKESLENISEISVISEEKDIPMALLVSFVEKKNKDLFSQTIGDEILITDTPVCVFGHFRRYEQLGPTERHTLGYPHISGFTPEQITRIDEIIKNIYYFTIIFRGVRNDSSYNKWFGLFNTQNAQKIDNTINSVRQGGCPTYRVMNGTGTSYCKPDTYAFILYDRKYNANPRQCSSAEHFCHRIFLCNLFWTRPVKGPDSQTGIFVHELTHGYSYTRDHVYGRQLCTQLAIRNPLEAIENADNIEYYVEDVLLQ